MKTARWALAWALFLIGDLVWRVFDVWTGIGMHWPIYRTYSTLMTWSGEAQGSGRGPWVYATTTEKAG